MIDLKKPLEGAPGLLLMAALIFFGAFVGIAMALGFKWIKLEPDMANFLGGVVGAFLGSSMAVAGAFLLQEREKGEKRGLLLNEVWDRLVEVQGLVAHVQMGGLFGHQDHRLSESEAVARARRAQASELIQSARRLCGDYRPPLELPYEQRSKVTRSFRRLGTALYFVLLAAQELNDSLPKEDERWRAVREKTNDVLVECEAATNIIRHMQGGPLVEYDDAAG